MSARVTHGTIPGGSSSTDVLKTLTMAGPTMIAGAALIAGPAATLLVIGEGVLAVLVVMVLTSLVTVRITEVVP